MKLKKLAREIAEWDLGTILTFNSIGGPFYLAPSMIDPDLDSLDYVDVVPVMGELNRLKNKDLRKLAEMVTELNPNLRILDGGKPIRKPRQNKD